MLTAAALGMASYGLYSCVSAVIDLLGTGQYDILPNIGEIVFGILLILAAAFVRVQMPGGLPLAVSALLGLLAVSIYNAPTAYGYYPTAPFVARAAFSLLLLALAYSGGRRSVAGIPKSRGPELER
jgi:hypothetical protein